MAQKGFKLIAVRPLENCAPKFLKVLQPDEFYYFHKNYRIIIHDDDEEIVIDDNFPPEIFNICSPQIISQTAYLSLLGL